MNMMASQLPIMLRREMWEHKNSVVWLPVILAAIAMFALLLGLIFVADDIKTHMSTAIEWGSEQRQLPLEERSRTIQFDAKAVEIKDDDRLKFLLWSSDVNNVMRGLAHGSAMYFQIIAFFAAIFYLLGSLHADRTNKSILFWKSLPVTETKNVLVKLLFALIAFPLVAFFVSLVMEFFLELIVAYLYSQSHVYTFFDALQQIAVTEVVAKHGVLIFTFFIKSIPLYAWLLFCSALARTTPFIVAFLPPVVVVILERLVLGTNYSMQFFHYVFFPGDYDFQALMNKEFLVSAVTGLTFSLQQLSVSLVTAAGLLYGAVWLRNNSYEI